MYWNLLLMNPISITYITNYKIFQDIQNLKIQIIDTHHVRLI